jgi:hypothetical protein
MIIDRKCNQVKLDSFRYSQDWTLSNQYISIYEEENKSN